MPHLITIESRFLYLVQWKKSPYERYSLDEGHNFSVTLSGQSKPVVWDEIRTYLQLSQNTSFLKTV